MHTDLSFEALHTSAGAILLLLLILYAEGMYPCLPLAVKRHLIEQFGEMGEMHHNNVSTTCTATSTVGVVAV